MKKIYFTPGPSQLYYSVEKHIESALKEDIMSMSHRSESFKSLYSETINNLRALLEIPPD